MGKTSVGYFNGQSMRNVVNAMYSRVGPSVKVDTMTQGSRGNCPVCNSTRDELLVPPHPSRSITSGGIILDVPLRKVQCLACGLSRQDPHSEALKTDLYRNNYALYHRRPGTSASEAARYASMANWIFAELGSFLPNSLLDVGCAGGLLLEALRNVKPSIEYAGIEPSIENGALARKRGFSVTTGFIPAVKPPRERYDLVLASNVISHITDPIAFLRAMASMTSPTGRVVIYSHDGAQPSADLLWADIDFSFCREHLGALGAKAGLSLSSSKGFSPPSGQEDKHILVFEHASASVAVPPLGDVERERLIVGRRRYFEAWRTLSQRLAGHAIEATGPVMNFGASFWSMSLASYCPEYWRRVDACVVDAGGGTFLDKPVLSTADVPISPRPLIVLGTNPSIQKVLKERLATLGSVVGWEDLISR